MDLEKTVEELRRKLANSEQRVKRTLRELQEEECEFFIGYSLNIPTQFSRLSSRDERIGDNHPTAPYPAFRFSAERQEIQQ